MIVVDDVVRDLPHFDAFYSVESLQRLAEALRTDARFTVTDAGVSANGQPIHHIRFGKGATKALIVGGPHAPEVIGSLTVAGLILLLRQGNRALLDADVEWHIVPCIDPDGARLNEGWSQKPFTLESYMRHFYLQAPPDQVDTSFPIAHKKLVHEHPSPEARVLRDILDEVRPDFFFSLHNASFGGAFFFLNRGIGERHYRDIHELVRRQHFPLQKRPIWKEMCPAFAAGIVEMWTVGKYYDFLERSTSAPEKAIRFGAGSWDHLAGIKPDALTFVAEMGYVRHPADESECPTGQNLRQFILRQDADRKFIAAALCEEWAKVAAEANTASPFYRAVVEGGLIPTQQALADGSAQLAPYPVAQILLDPQYDRPMTEGDRFNACVDTAYFLFTRFQVVRLLQASPQSAGVRRGAARLESLFTAALQELGKHVPLDEFRATDCDTLARVQLGSGLLALNSVIEARTA